MQLRFLILLAFAAALGLTRADDTSIPAPSPSRAQASAQKFQNIDVTEFEKLRANTNNVVLDVRTRREYASGHMPGAINIDVKSPDFEKKVSTLDPKKTYLVHCAAGVRSSEACRKLSGLHFAHLYNMEGGFRAWEHAGHEPQR